MSEHVHVAGNSALDLVVRGRLGAGEGADGWGANVEILQQPVVPSLGGCGAAPAYLLGCLGQSVSLSTNLADDAFGQLLTGWLTAAGVRLTAPLAGAATAAHVIHVDGDLRRSSYYRGARVGWEAGLPDGIDWFVATGYGAVEADDLRQLSALFTSLRQRCVRVVFDPSPWFAGRVEVDDMLALWRHVDVLTATEAELSHYLPGAGRGAELAVACAEQGPTMVAVKRGAEGACWYAEGDQGEAPVSRRVIGNSVGAGDTFNARLVHGLMSHEPAAATVAAAVELATDVVAAGRGVLGAFEEETP